eukprot:c12476_g1_i1.p1 GENE.c12476_g1_i1~~c12476_g1_i1.p1  ORF type:complete len:165 (-),score=13.76 c12476_g1_i1:79-573(-)
MEFRFTGKKKQYVKIKRKFLNLLLLEKYQELSQELLKYPDEEIKSFFIEEGYGILKQAILASTARLLEFIVQKIPLEAVRHVFDNDKIDFLEGFLYAKKMMESRGSNDQKERDLMIEKFILFLKLEPIGVQEFMNEYTSNKDYTTQSIIEDYQSALKSFNSQKV